MYHFKVDCDRNDNSFESNLCEEVHLASIYL